MPKQITPLYHAAINNRIDACRLLLEHSASINSIQSKYAMLYVAERGHINICKLLLDYGMSPNCDVDDEHCKGPVIHKAIDGRHTNVIKLLISKGANTSETEKWCSPLRYAIRCNYYDMCELLIKEGIIPNDDRIDRTPLYEAVGKKNIDISKLLISNGVTVCKELTYVYDDVDGDVLHSDEHNEEVIERSHFLLDVLIQMREDKQ